MTKRVPFEYFHRIVDLMRLRKQAYQTTIGQPEQNAMLRDLARFCRAGESCFHADARLHAVLEGRREVWLRIANHLHMNPEDLAKLYANIQSEKLKDIDPDD